MAGAGGAYSALLARLDGVRALGVELGLDRMVQALARLGDPQARFAAVQIAGTNGKGSTAAMTEAVLRVAGFRTGLYSSPHLARFTERIRIGGQEADGEQLAALDGRVAATAVPLTYFEVATALAFLSFAEAGVEIAVLETGLGGRLDAVTTCLPSATAITTIGFDHMGYLGDTLPAIAREKAGILKPGVPCFLGRLPAEADDVVTEVARGVGAPMFRLGRDFRAPSLPLALAGAHQADNGAIAVALARPLRAGRRRSAVRRRAQSGRRSGAGGRVAGAGGGPPRRPARVDRRRQGSGGDPGGARAGRGGDRHHALGQRAVPSRGGAGGSGGAIHRGRDRLRRRRRRAGGGAQLRGTGRPGGRLRLDVPGRDAAGARPGRARRSAADVRSNRPALVARRQRMSISSM